MPKSAICLVLDRLHAGTIGAYGNSWIETPSLDRLASQAFLFDQALLDSPELGRLCRSYWQGWHALAVTVPESHPSLAKLLHDAGVKTVLLTDEPQIARHPLAGDFDELIEIDPPTKPQLTAGEIEQTHFGRCFVRIIDWLESVPGPFLLWCHLGGLGTTWDAPLGFRQAYRDHGDPPPPESADVPNRTLPADFDPDELLGITQAYCGQVTLLDTCLGAFLDFFDSLSIRPETLLTLTSARGFPLGEHRRVGECDGALFGETLHVPWMMQLPDGVGAAVRSQALVEPSDLWATLLDWWDIAGAADSPTAASVMPLVREPSETSPFPPGQEAGQSPAKLAGWRRDRLCAVGREGQRAIRTPAWYLRADLAPELFAKPDDRCEVNNVASRCAEVVERLQAALIEYELTLLSGRVSDLPPLADVLLHGLA
jgi:arylsulfatase A-like enzyme